MKFSKIDRTDYRHQTTPVTVLTLWENELGSNIGNMLFLNTDPSNIIGVEVFDTFSLRIEKWKFTGSFAYDKFDERVDVQNALIKFVRDKNLPKGCYFLWNVTKHKPVLKDDFTSVYPFPKNNPPLWTLKDTSVDKNNFPSKVYTMNPFRFAEQNFMMFSAMIYSASALMAEVNNLTSKEIGKYFITDLYTSFIYKGSNIWCEDIGANEYLKFPGLKENKVPENFNVERLKSLADKLNINEEIEVSPFGEVEEDEALLNDLLLTKLLELGINQTLSILQKNEKINVIIDVTSDELKDIKELYLLNGLLFIKVKPNFPVTKYDYLDIFETDAISFLFEN